MSETNLATHQQITLSKQFFELVMTKVRQARDEILLAAFTLEFDAFGQALLSELEYACQRGLRVRCLINSQGSQNFINDHPKLFTLLQTEIRIQHGRGEQNTRIVFDRELALVGSHPLCATNPATAAGSRIIAGAAAAEIADSINAAWEKSLPYADMHLSSEIQD